MSIRASLIAQLVKNPPAMQETPVLFLGWEDPLEKGYATHSSILAWRIPWTEEPGRLQSQGHKESDTTEWLSLSLTIFSQILVSWELLKSWGKHHHQEGEIPIIKFGNLYFFVKILAISIDSRNHWLWKW